jgi:hypothetical protein
MACPYPAATKWNADDFVFNAFIHWRTPSIVQILLSEAIPPLA